MTVAKSIHENEISKGLETIARYSERNPAKLIEQKVQERIDFLKSMTDEQIEFSQNFIKGSVFGNLGNYESLVSFVNKNFK